MTVWTRAVEFSLEEPDRGYIHLAYTLLDRGLPLSRMQKELKTPVAVVEKDYPDVDEVDVKLLRLCREEGAVVVTNDYNLNKVAGGTGIRVLNINDLANAVKPMLMAGEELRVQIVREGKEPGQGVAYLDDGTMIVVENGRRHVGEQGRVVVPLP